MRVQVPLDHLLRRRRDGIADLGIQPPDGLVDQRGRLLDQPERTNHLPSYPDAGDREVLDGSRCLGSVERILRYRYLPHRVLFDA